MAWLRASVACSTSGAWPIVRKMFGTIPSFDCRAWNAALAASVACASLRGAAYGMTDSFSKKGEGIGETPAARNPSNHSTPWPVATGLVRREGWNKRVLSPIQQPGHEIAFLPRQAAGD